METPSAPPETAKLCIGCLDQRTQQTGDFLSELDRTYSVGPVFPGLIALFDWTKTNAWVNQPYNPAYPVGTYTKA